MKSKFLKRLALGGLVFCALILVVYLCRAPLLRGVARAWVVNDRLTRADVIVVLGGGPSTRPFTAAKLFHQGLAPLVLLTNPKPTGTTELGLAPTEANLERSILMKENVPAESIVIARRYVNSTYEEALAVRNWAATNNVRRIIIPTDSFHTRRAGWVFRKELKPLGIQVVVDAVPVREYSLTDWWQHEQGIVAFHDEILKYAYYRIEY